jgi:hypothetical protein
MKSIREIQEKLKELGLYTGNVDGLSGPKTIAAIRAFQRINGLTADGKVGPKTLEKLFVPDLGRDVIPDEPVVKPPAQPSSVWKQWPKEGTESLTRFFGAPGTNIVSLELPYEMKIAWDLRQKIRKFSCNAKVKDTFEYIFQKVKDTYSEKEIEEIGLNLFGGCLNVRPIRGGTRLSTHAWACAVDISPTKNQLRWGRDKARLAKPDAEEFWKIVESTGCVSLGRTVGWDYMHFQACVR